MHIDAHSIVYTDHKVVCNPGPNWSEKFVTEYIAEMAAALSATGNMRSHAKELRHMNNDGTWGIRKLAH